jgi:ABC-type transport system substrate-binding protein
MTRKKFVALLGGLTIFVLVLSACAPPTPETVTVIQTQIVEQVETVTVLETQVVVEEVTAEPAASYTTPHPILGDIRNRQGIAHCTNRAEVINSVYPFVEDQSVLFMDSFVPTDHWSHADGLVQYPFDPEAGMALFEEAGWTLADGAAVRTNADGEEFTLKFTTTNAQFRQTWGAVFQSNMADCGLQILPFYTPGSWWFGSSSGLRRRDFELGAFAWVGEADPGGRSLYACDQIPLPENGWNGQNYMGWCNETASAAIIAANNTLSRDERIAQYAIAQQEFAKDMVSIPMFNRLEAEAASTNLVNWSPDPTDYITRNAYEWELADGGDTLVIGFSQEPATMFSIFESAAVQRQAAYLVQEPSTFQESYDFQPNLFKSLPTVDNGGATNEAVEVAEGDIVYTSAGEPGELAAGVEVTDSEGNLVTYEGGALSMNQLTVTFEYVDGLTWSDGEPVKQADIELAYKINCDHDSGAVTYTACDALAPEGGVTFNGMQVTVKFVPGWQDPTYFVGLPWAFGGNEGFDFYPSHQVLADGRLLADVPAAEWSTLPEVAETPLGTGPYMLVDWVPGQSMTFEANPNYWRGEVAINTVVIQFVADSQTAVAQFLQGQLDVLERATLGAGQEVQTVIEAADSGQPVQVDLLPSPTWEHIDMNLFIK